MELLTDGHAIYEYAHDGCATGQTHCAHERPVAVYRLTARFDRVWQQTLCMDANKLYPYTKEDPD